MNAFTTRMNDTHAMYSMLSEKGLSGPLDYKGTTSWGMKDKFRKMDNSVW